MEEPKNETTEQPAEPMVPIEMYNSIKQIPPGTVFNFSLSGTAYFKMPDGSLRNLKKYMKRHGIK